MKARAGSAAALVLALLAGCRVSGEEAQRPSTPVSSSMAPQTSAPNAGQKFQNWAPAAPTPQYLMPLALVVHATRPTSDEPVPYVIDNSFTPRLVGDSRSKDILADLWRSSRGPFAP